MTPEAPGTAPAEDPRPWRRFIVVLCDDCKWSAGTRDWRSKRYGHRKRFNAAANKHAAETGHEHVGVFVTHI